ILAVLGSALFVYNWLYFSVSDASHEARVSLLCSADAGDPLAGVADAPAYAQRAHRFNTCLAQVTHPKGFWILGGVGAMVLLALVIYLLTPAWQRRRRRLVPLQEEDVPEVVAELRRLSHQAGLSRPPRFLWNPLDG